MFHYIQFYKPYQVLSQFSPDPGKKTLADCFDDLPTDVYPVGRLDYDSEGLLLLTNDKKWNGLLLNPDHRHERCYYVEVEGEISQQAMRLLENGVNIRIDGKAYKTRRARVRLLEEAPDLPERNPPVRFRKNIPTSWVALTLHEGKNRQVRRMTAAVGFPTLRLVRYSMGSLHIGGMQSGEWKRLSAEEWMQSLR